MKLKLLFGAFIFYAITANAQLASINENFDSFATVGTGSLPQNNWTTKINVVDPASDPLLSVEGAADKYIQAYSLFSPNVPFYLISPQIIAPTIGQTLSVSTLRIGGVPGGTGTLQIGLVASPTDMSTFTPIGNAIVLSSSTATTTTVNVPTSTYQYIAFKFTASMVHQALRLDNVVLAAAGSLGTSDNVKSSGAIKFATNSENTELQFITKKDPKKIHVYSAAGQKVAEGKLNNQRFDISKLQKGIYYIAIETAEGSITKSKFIKK